MTSFEDYLAKFEESVLQASRKNVDRLGLNFTLHLLLRKANSSDGPQEAYGCLHRGISELHQCLQIKVDQLSSTFSETRLPIIESLARAFWELDEQCGQNLEPIVRGLAPEEEQRRLALLDQDRARFKEYLQNRLASCPSEYPRVREILLYFAELIFMFNAYQAPFRSDPAKAFQDSLGESDLFAELLEEIENKDAQS